MYTPSDVKDFVVELFSETDTVNLFYHSLAHTLAVADLVKTIVIAESQSIEICELMEISALLHDVGYLYTYHAHEEKGMELAQKWMPSWGFSTTEIEFVCSMIEATKLSQLPNNELQAIISDVDLAYGVTSSFFERGPLLRREWVLCLNKLYSDLEWENLQLNFLQNVKFSSAYGQAHFQAVVENNLKKQQIRVNALEKD